MKIDLTKIKPIHIFIFCFLFYSLINLCRAPRYLLIDDELVYLTLARSMRDGGPVFFDRTNPYLFPLTISIFANQSILIVRTLMVIFMSAAMGIYFNMLQKHSDKITALIATMLFVFHSRTAQYAIQVYTEGLLLVLLLLSIDLLADILKGKASWRNFILLGVYMGLSLETKSMIPIVPFFFIIWILLRSKGRNLIKTAIALAVSILLYLPYHILHGARYLRGKIISNISIEEIIERLYFAKQHLGIIFIFFFSIALGKYFLKKSKENREFTNILLSFCSLYVFFLLFVVNGTLPRYFFICLPIMCFFIAKFIFYGNFKSKFDIKGTTALFCLLLVVILSNIGNIPDYNTNVHFIPNPKDTCFELTKTKQDYLYREAYPLEDWTPDLSKAKKMNMEEKGVDIKLPVFSQDDYSVAKYHFDFSTSLEFKYIFLIHPCDKMQISLDGNKLTHGWIGSPFFPIQISLKKPLKSGEHKLTLRIYNDTNLGGIGQVMLCEKSLPEYLPKSYRNYSFYDLSVTGK